MSSRSCKSYDASLKARVAIEVLKGVSVVEVCKENNIPKTNALDLLILYLASNNASKYLTGTTFTIDGGMSWGGKSW